MKIQKHHVCIDNELVIPTTTIRRFSAKEVAKKNCLVFIAKNLNLTQLASDAKCIQELLGEELIIDIYFSRAQGEMHNGSANVEVLNPLVYKKFVKTTVKLDGKDIKLISHLRNIDGTSIPDENTLKEFGFLDVNTAIANVVITLTNTQ